MSATKPRMIPDARIATGDIERETAFSDTIRARVMPSVADEGASYVVTKANGVLRGRHKEKIVRYVEERRGSPDEKPHEVVAEVAYNVYDEKVESFRGLNDE